MVSTGHLEKNGDLRLWEKFHSRVQPYGIMGLLAVYSIPLPLSPLESKARQRKGKASPVEPIHLFITE